MSNENLSPPSVVEMVKITGANTAQFMEQIALHIEKLEAEVVRLSNRIKELEGENGTISNPTE
jgi:cell division protein FtsB